VGVFRTAGPGDLEVLVDIECDASTRALAHIFGDIPFPVDDVRARWAPLLADPTVVVLLALDPEGESLGYVAWDAVGWLRHLAVRPSHWGEGLGRRLHDACMDALAGRGVQTSYLWVLEENHRARDFYTALGWESTGVREREVFEPFPVKVQLVRSSSTASSVRP
jgi:GNAT superfamily N-acetyltransferase